MLLDFFIISNTTGVSAWSQQNDSFFLNIQTVFIHNGAVTLFLSNQAQQETTASGPCEGRVESLKQAQEPYMMTAQTDSKINQNFVQSCCGLSLV